MRTKKSSTKVPATKAKPATVAPTELQRIHPDSRPNQIARLDVGESLSHAVRMDFSATDREEIESKRSTLKSTMSKAAVAAAARSGGKFITEIGDFRTRSGDIIAVAVVTRLN